MPDSDCPPEMSPQAHDDLRDDLRDAVAAIRLATSILSFDGASWLQPLPPAERVRIRGVLASLDSASSELVAQVGTDPAQVEAIARETARVIAAREQQPVAALSKALVRLEVIAAVEAPPRPQLALDVATAAVLPIESAALVSALYAAAFGLVRSRPLRRTPWTVAVSARDEQSPDGRSVVVIELRCEVADDSVARTSSGVGPALPPWLHECVRLTDGLGGGLSRGRDGSAEVVRMILPVAATTGDPVGDSVAASPDEAAANDRPLPGRRAA